MTFSSISLSKTHAILGKMQDISQNPEDNDGEREDNTGLGASRSQHSRSQRKRSSSSIRRVHNERQLLLQQSKSFRDFETLFAVLDAMEQWKDVADQADV